MTGAGVVNDSVVPALIAATCEAGSNALSVLSGGFEVDTKDDNSPVTRADLEADRIIRSRLQALSDLPVVSEEHALPDPVERRSWARYFLVDPLDGTRGFVERGDEFAVSIALMEDETPALGVIALPTQNAVYVGGPQFASRKLTGTMMDIARAPEKALDLGELLPHPVDREPPPAPHTLQGNQGADSSSGDALSPPLRIVASRHNLNDETRSWIEELRRLLGTVELVQAGSAAKFTMIAAGAADVYPRLAPCMEWDSAAGVAIVHGAGGRVVATVGSGTGGVETISFGDPRWRSAYFIAWSAHAVSRGWSNYD